MSCNLTEKISLLMDGALSSNEAAETRSHVATCAECRKTIEDFTRLREALRDYDSAPGDVAQRRALNMILSTDRAPLWSRRVPVPVPLLALLILAFVSLAAWSFSIPLRRPAAPVTSTLFADGGGGDGGKHADGALATDLSRLDHGGRAVIVKAARPRRGDAPQPGRDLQ